MGVISTSSVVFKKEKNKKFFKNYPCGEDFLFFVEVLINKKISLGFINKKTWKRFETKGSAMCPTSFNKKISCPVYKMEKHPFF